MLKLLILFLVILSPQKPTDLEKTWLNEVNELRRSERTKPLVLDRKLTAQCEKYAKKLARSRDFKHDPRLKKNQGENIAMNSGQSDNPIEIWKHSNGHRRNMLDRDFRQVGMGQASNGQETYFVMRLK